MNIEQAKQIIANNIRAERTRARMSQEETAEQLNITSRTYMKYEQNVKAIDCDILVKLSNLFKCDINDFFLNLEFTKRE